MVQVGAERPARDGRFEVLVGRGHETDVDGNLAVAADGTDTPLLQGAQQLHLRFVTQVPYFVEEQRASVGRLESPSLVGQSPREGPLDMTEKLRSRQIAGNGPAVDRHEGLSGPLAFPVDQLRHMLLARAARTVDQHRHIGRGHQPDVFVQLPGGVAAALDVVERLLRKAPGRTRRGLRSGFRGRRRRNIQRFTDLFQQFVGIHRFGHIVACAELHAPHGVLDFGVTRHHDHRRRDTRSRHPLQQGDAVLVRQAHVAQHEREASRLKSRARRRHRRGGPDSETAFREPRAQHQGKSNIVVDNQNPLFHRLHKDSVFSASATIARIFPAAARSSPQRASGNGPSHVSPRRSVSATSAAPSIVKIGSILCASVFTVAASPSPSALSSSAQFPAVCSANERRMLRAASGSSPA